MLSVCMCFLNAFLSWVSFVLLLVFVCFLLSLQFIVVSLVSVVYYVIKRLNSLRSFVSSVSHVNPGTLNKRLHVSKYAVDWLSVSFFCVFPCSRLLFSPALSRMSSFGTLSNGSATVPFICTSQKCRFFHICLS